MSSERFKKTAEERKATKEAILLWRADMKRLYPNWTKRSRFGNGKFPQRGMLKKS